MQIKLSEQDLPVSQTYINQVASQGATVLYPLKWINGAVIKTEPTNLKKILEIPAVKGLYKNMALDSVSGTQTNAANRKISNESLLDYGVSFAQLTQIGVDIMHQKGIHGENTLITLLDDGFLDANISPVLAPIFNEKRVLATLATEPTEKNV